MSTVKPLQKDVGPATRDLTTHQWHACKRTTSNQVPGIDVADTTESVAGILELPGHAAGVSSTYHTVGRSKVKVGTAVQAGDFGRVGATPGVAVPAAPGEAYFCRFAEAGPAGAIVACDLVSGLRAISIA
ncbi:hypothetical protein [Deinococcus aquiradiocola]|uniref:Uncharacterized protein n=1 Tax=Deinococcus aquiradiocola TaxID=393059 RepID=A0A917P7C3_9DEIO|nr:hypothetical protein [Deinococcus aquiradiocola]GGJ65303.1 hypothetical protein GCM10008939_06520 [Deinococcus aquiradiocola]